MKFNMWLKKMTTPFLWSSGILIVLAFIFSKIQAPFPITAFFYILAFLLSGISILWRALSSLKYKTVSIELLVSIAAIGACFIGEFNESAIVTFLFQFGSFLEQKTMKKTRSAIKALTEMAPTTAFRMDENGDLEEIDADEVEVDDILLVKTGSQIASDGIVTKGEGYVTEASITGEPVPKHKAAGDTIYAGTILDSGTLQLKATKVGEDTTFSRIIALVEEAQDAKSPVERFIDRFAKYYTPAVILIAFLVLIFTGSIDTSITVLVLACPGALVIGAPIANVSGIGRGALDGILLKGGDSIHTFARTDTFVFDKTGTLTKGMPSVCEVKSYTANDDEVLSLIKGAEKTAEHPLARAILNYRENVKAADIDSAESIKGKGIDSYINGHHVLVGNKALMDYASVSLSEIVKRDLEELQAGGSTTVLAAIDGEIKMLLGISDEIKADAREGLFKLKALGIKQLVMLTGDNIQSAKAISEQLGISEYHAELLPQDKLSFIRQMQADKHIVTFVGDGINDSPALAAADTGIAMGSGTDVAIDNSDVVLIKSDLDSLAASLDLSKKTVAVMYQNIFIAVGTVILLLIGLFAGYIHMSIGMLIHEASILVVIFNAMRLLIPKKRKE